ncbi:MAG: hypothetical protein WBA93_10415 [Microcoleaceae cyanobacterium]
MTDVDSIRRLIAVRQITGYLSNYKLNKIDFSRQKLLANSSNSRMITSVNGCLITRSQIVDYFHLMLSRDSEPIVRNAVLDG